MESEVNRNIEEQLSAFLDGELSADELQLLVRRLEVNDDYRETLARYASIGGLLRNDGPQLLADRLRHNVMNALEQDGAEPIPEDAVPASAGRAWFRPAAAAAVAVLAVAGILNLDFGAPTEPAPIAQQAALAVPVATETTPAADGMTSATRRADAFTMQAKPMDQERMLSYMVSHGEYARSFQGAMRDSRVFVQQSSFEE